MTDSLDTTFEDLERCIGDKKRLAAMHADPFFHFVHAPEDTFKIHQRLPRWRAALEKNGWAVEVRSLRELLWTVVDASGRWDDWLSAEEPGHYEEPNGSMRDVLRDNLLPNATARRGLARMLGPLLEDETPHRLLMLTDAALLHPWFRVRTLETSFRDKIRCPTVLFYPGRRQGQFGLHFLGFYAEDGNYRSILVGGS